ncbi:MAG TPA: glycosyltransferase [Bryobacteraceae bacterium]|nr:glycosyltransferase [Bryobacteraceae bacterium]
MTTASYLVLVAAVSPFVYYVIVLFSAARYRAQQAPGRTPSRASAFQPPVSILKPIRGLDPDSYENLASFCRLDYPDYEIVCCIDAEDTSIHHVLDRLARDFPGHAIRVLEGSGRVATNDKVAKLARMVSEARHEVVVISDSDVRVRPDYLRAVTAPLLDPAVGAVTCFYVPLEVKSFADRLQSAGMIADFYAGILTAWQLDGVKFALGPTIATTRTRLAEFGGYAALENQPADDLLVGRLIAERGHEVVLSSYVIQTVSDYGSLRDLIHKRLRWIVVMRHMRPWGHFGLAFTQGLPWTLVAMAASPSWAVARVFLGIYVTLRAVIMWSIGSGILKQPLRWRELALIPVWDAMAFFIWLASFTRRSIRWRGADYYIQDGRLVLVDRPDVSV